MSEDKLIFLDPEQLMECPYDKTHMIRSKRFPYHLLKCRRNHVTRDYASCPFNARHDVPAQELRHHITTCPDRCRLDQDLVHDMQKQGENVCLKGCTDVPAYNTIPIAPTSEDWENENQSVDRYVHGPGSYAGKTRLDSQEGLLEQFYLKPKKPTESSSLTGVSIATEMALNNPIYMSYGRRTPSSQCDSESISSRDNSSSSPQDILKHLGVGRGRGAQKQNSSNPPAYAADSSPHDLKYLGRGRGPSRDLLLTSIGRGRGQYL